MKILGSGGRNRSEFHPGLDFHAPGPQKNEKKPKNPRGPRGEGGDRSKPNNFFMNKYPIARKAG